MPTLSIPKRINYDAVSYEDVHLDDGDDSWDAFWIECLGFCGCGTPEELMPSFVDYLKWCAKPFDERKAMYPKGSYSNSIMLLIAYVCDERRLCEHGTSLGFQWLTAYGEAWLRLLVAKPTPKPD